MKRIACIGDSITWGFTLLSRRARMLSEAIYSTVNW